MRKLSIGAAVIAAALSLALSAFAMTASAQDGQGQQSVPDHQYDFEDGSEVGGTLHSPLGDIIQAGRLHRSTSLVRARMHFVPEMVKSVENL